MKLNIIRVELVEEIVKTLSDPGLSYCLSICGKVNGKGYLRKESQRGI